MVVKRRLRHRGDSSVTKSDSLGIRNNGQPLPSSPLRRMHDDEVSGMEAMLRRAKQQKTTTAKTPMSSSVSKMNWTRNDELIILASIVDYEKDTKLSYQSDWDAFYGYIIGSIEANFSKKQLKDKIRNLVKRFTDRKRLSFSTEDDEIFKLSMLIWGTNETECENVDQDKVLDNKDVPCAEREHEPLDENMDQEKMPPKQPPRHSKKRQHSSSSSPPDSPPTNPTAPWPRQEGLHIQTKKVWDKSDKDEALSDACHNRPISETWDDYDTLFYNAWLKVGIAATRFADPVILRRMGILDDILHMLETIGLGTMCTKHYIAYPDLVRQFLSTVSVYYTSPAKRASEGTLTFMLQGQRYRLSIPDLCDIYGFDKMCYSAAWPSEFTDQQRVWSSFGTGRYDSKHSTQTDVRHPVVRYVARLIANTILCKSEPGKMRHSELMLLSYGVENLHEPGEPDLQRIGRVNFGAIFAQHLVSLKTKPFSGTQKKPETVGSLLTPIFQHFAISLDHLQRISAPSLMDEEHLKSAKWLKADLLWCYRAASGDHMVQLPNPDLTTITETLSCLHFLPDPPIRLPALPARAATGSTRRAPQSAADFASSSTSAPPAFTHLPATLPPDFVPDPFQRFMIESLHAIWDRISRCTCMSPPTTATDAASEADDTDED